jgi:hypothetical protein
MPGPGHRAAPSSRARPQRQQALSASRRPQRDLFDPLVAMNPAMKSLKAPQRFMRNCVADLISRKETRLRGACRTRTQKTRRKLSLERSRRFPELQPNCGHRDYSCLSRGVGDTQLGWRGIPASVLAQTLGFVEWKATYSTTPSARVAGQRGLERARKGNFTSPSAGPSFAGRFRARSRRADAAERRWRSSAT